MIVAHDDLDLPLGTLRLRPGGGSAGQKGMASIIQQLGTQDFARLRLGIGRPPGQMDPAAYVLQRFSAARAGNGATWCWIGPWRRCAPLCAKGWTRP